MACSTSFNTTLVVIILFLLAQKRRYQSCWWAKDFVEPSPAPLDRCLSSGISSCRVITDRAGLAVHSSGDDSWPEHRVQTVENSFEHRVKQTNIFHSCDVGDDLQRMKAWHGIKCILEILCFWLSVLDGSRMDNEHGFSPICIPYLK